MISLVLHQVRDFSATSEIFLSRSYYVIPNCPTLENSTQDSNRTPRDFSKTAWSQKLDESRKLKNHNWIRYPHETQYPTRKKGNDEWSTSFKWPNSFVAQKREKDKKSSQRENARAQKCATFQSSLGVYKQPETGQRSLFLDWTLGSGHFADAVDSEKSVPDINRS